MASMAAANAAALDGAGRLCLTGTGAWSFGLTVHFSLFGSKAYRSMFDVWNHAAAAYFVHAKGSPEAQHTCHKTVKRRVRTILQGSQASSGSKSKAWLRLRVASTEATWSLAGESRL